MLGIDGRVLVRPSGTEPLIRVMLEGKDFELINKYAKEPDLVLLLDVDVKTSVNRCSKEDEFENEEFLSNVKANYLDLISNFNHEIIDASTGVNKVSTDIKKAVAPYMGICPDCIR